MNIILGKLVEIECQLEAPAEWQGDLNLAKAIEGPNLAVTAIW